MLGLIAHYDHGLQELASKLCWFICLPCYYAEKNWDL